MKKGEHILTPTFFSYSTPEVARSLLGCLLIRQVGSQRLAGRIIETEAYRGPGDPASHAYRGPTPRSRIMFGPPGRAYVYLCYGFHCLLNVTTEKTGVAGAVLIRGLTPIEGEEIMSRNRGGKQGKEISNGPGKLTQALGVGLKDNGADMTSKGKLYLVKGFGLTRKEKIFQGPRVGIKKGLELPWRFCLLK